jgi:chaperone BCS1
MQTADGLNSQVYKPGLLGLDLANSLTRAMGFSFLTSLFSGTPLANTTFPDGVRLFMLGSIIETGRRFCNWAFERFKIRWSITAQFDEGDPACEWLVNYLTEENVWKRSRDFIVSAKSSQLRWGVKMRSIESAEYVPRYKKPHLFRWKGYWVEIQRTERPYDPATMGFAQPGMATSSILLTMYTLDIEALSNLVEEARLKYIEGRRPHVIVHGIDMTIGNTWNMVKRKNRRPLESIVLPDGLLGSLVQDVKDFLQTENWYMRAGIPYRRGYLLYGPPGTGKTSTIYALAGELGLEIYTISLSSGFVDDNMLRRAISSLPKHSIFLLEDIDCAFPSREEEEEEERMMKRGMAATPAQWGYPRAFRMNQKPVINVTMSGLLNVLDGVGSEDGKLFFATTNYVDRLDPALLRPGRIDLKVEYKLATKSQAIALFNRFYPRHEEESNGAAFSIVFSEKHLEDGTVLHSTPPAELDRLNAEFASYIPDNEFTTAELQGYLLLHRKSPQSAVDNVEKWIENERADKEKRKEAEAARRAKSSTDGDDALIVPQISVPVAS